MRPETTLPRPWAAQAVRMPSHRRREQSRQTDHGLEFESIVAPQIFGRDITIAKMMQPPAQTSIPSIHFLGMDKEEDAHL